MLLAGAALVLAWLAHHDTWLMQVVVADRALEWMIAGLAAAVGCMAGARFPAGCAWLGSAGLGVGATASVANAADLVGAAAGSFAVGLVLLSVFGFSGACWLLAALQAIGCLAAASGILAMRISAIRQE